MWQSRIVTPVVLLSLSTGPTSGQPYRVRVEAVQVDVFVGNGKRTVVGLEAKDFELYDNDVLQRIVRVETPSVSVNVILTLDTSHSVNGKRLEHLRSAASLLLHGLKPADGAALLTFSTSVDAVTAFEGSLRPVLSALASTRGLGSTSLNDGLYAALKLADGVEHPRIVVFTDGEDRFSWITEDQVFQAARYTEAPLFVVATVPDVPRLGTSTDFLKELCSLTGGDYLEVATSEDLTDTFSNILAQMKTRYVLSFLPHQENAPGWHSLRVRVKQRGVDVRARRGYYVIGDN